MASVAVAAVSMYSAKRGADKQAKGAKDAGRLQQSQQAQTRADLAPWREMGGRAVTGLEQLMGTKGDFDPSVITRSPGYQFRMNEMVKGLDRSASAGGRLDSGRYGKELGRYLQDYASAEYDKQFNRLSSMSDRGGGPTVSGAQMGAASAATTGRYMQTAGNAGASGVLGQGAGLNNAIQGGYENYLYRNNMNQWQGNVAGVSGALGQQGASLYDAMQGASGF